MAKFKMKGIKMLSNNKHTTLNFSNSGRSLSSSPLRVEPETEGEVTWNPETVGSVENQAVAGGVNQITNYNQTGNQNFNDSGDKLSNEDYEKLKQDPEYIKKEQLYLERQKEIERQRSETEFIPDDPNPSATPEPTVEKNQTLQRYVFASNQQGGSMAGFGRTASQSTGEYLNEEDAYKALSMHEGTDYSKVYNEMYLVNPDGTRSLVKGGPKTTTRQNMQWNPETKKIERLEGTSDFTTSPDESFPDMENLYANMFKTWDLKEEKSNERERRGFEAQAERKYQIEQAKAKREEEKASKAAIVAEKKRIAKEKVNENRAAKGLKLIE